MAKKTSKKIKILMAKPGIEGHWRGLVAVSNALRDGGFEVIYGSNMTPEEIANTAVQEDVDIVGLSIMSANYVMLVELVVKALKKAGKSDVMLLVGGIIWEEDFDKLKKLGATGVFVPGTPLQDIVDFVKDKSAALA
ncbi:MAG: methylmalonyl-CoA mutase [Spirochaetales bacterium]|nr:MAG: methylmalonyl-CoA mutase [Spirochaetales bacterium]